MNSFPFYTYMQPIMLLRDQGNTSYLHHSLIHKRLWYPQIPLTS